MPTVFIASSHNPSVVVSSPSRGQLAVNTPSVSDCVGTPEHHYGQQSNN